MVNVASAHATVETLLSLGRWGQIMGVNPFYLMGATTSVYDGGSACDQLFKQYSWMDADKVGREDISRAIAQAEADIATELGYWPAPKWIAGEDHEYPKHFDKQLLGVYGINQRGQGKSIKSEWGKVRSLGQEAKTLISAGVAIAIATNTVTVSVVTPVTDPNEIALYFRTTDGADRVASERYRIRPVKVAISAGTATITGHKAQFIKPTLWEAEADIDGDAAANYVTAVDIYRVYSDPSDPADFYWETLPEGCTDADESG